MMYCKDCVDVLDDYVDGALSPDEKDALEEHLSYCPPCVAFVRTYRATSRVARSHLVQDMPSEMSCRLHSFLRTQVESESDSGGSSESGENSDSNTGSNSGADSDSE